MVDDLDRKTLLNRVIVCVTNVLNSDSESVKPETHIFNDLGADSLDMTEIQMGVEEYFNIEIPDEDFHDIATVGQIVDYVEKRKGK